MKVITIGRSQENDCVINEPGVSKHNTQIIKTDDGRFFIVDMGSVNGTYVNGMRISGEQPLRPGDTVIVANTSVDWHRFFAVENTAPVPSAPQKKSRGGWILALILGIVAAALVAGFVVVMLYVKKQKNEDVKTIDNLNKEKAEYKEQVDKVENLTLRSLGDFNEQLEDSRSKTEKANKEIEATKKELEEAQKVAAALAAEKEALAKSKNAIESKLNKSDAAQKDLAEKISASEKSVADLQAQLEELNKKLDDSEQALQQTKEDYKKKMDEVKDFSADLQSAVERGITYEQICNELRFDYWQKDPKDVLYQKFEEGKGQDIKNVIANLKKQAEKQQ